MVTDRAYRYALAIYLLFTGFAYYMFYSIGLFVAQNFVPENASGFSVVNPKFSMMNHSIAAVLSVVVLVFLFANRRLKEYVVDVGDELTRVSWCQRMEAWRSTFTVIGLVIVSSIFLFVADFGVLKIVNFIMSLAA